MDMDALLGQINGVLTAAIGWVGTIGTTIVETPILLLGVVLTFVGFGVGLFRRLLNV